MRLLASHPTGNENVRAAVQGFKEASILGQFYTSIATFPGSIYNRLGKFERLSELRRREFDSFLRDHTETLPWPEIGRILATKIGLQKFTTHEKGFLSIDAVYKSFDYKIAKLIKKVRKNSITGVYAYEDGALNSFREARRQGLPCFYDLPIGYWRAANILLEQEKAKWPEWESTLLGFKDSEDKQRRKDEELQLADRIFVASRFTAATLKEFPGALSPIEIIPYGFPAAGPPREYSNLKQNKPIKLLFVGGLSQRKGIANLFSAIAAIRNHVSLTIIGQRVVKNCNPLNTHLLNHNWIPSLPHDKVLEQMRQHDILVFPSLFEGFGLVISEAMSQGTAVITTERTAGPDFIEHEKNGWLVSAGSSEDLQATIENLITRKQDIAEAGFQAMQTARKRPMAQYGRELAEAIIKTQQLPDEASVER